MSARSQRGIHDTSTTKRFRSPRVTTKNRVVKPQITYDYDAAVSQPDIPHLLDYKIGRGTMISGLPLKKRALKIRLKGRIMSNKNFQKRSQEFKTKSLVQKNTKTRSLDSENTNPTGKMIISSGIFKKEDHIAEKGNIASNAIIYMEDLANLRKNLIVDGKNISSKDTTEEAIENDDDNQITEGKVKNERSDDYESVSTRSPVQVKHSKIPRAKITVFPAHTFHECHPTKFKTKESPRLKCLMASDATDNTEVTDKEEKKRSCYKEPNSCKQDIIRFEAQDDTRIVWNKEETSTLEADEETEDHELTTADESPAIISGIGDPRILRILRNMKPNYPCKSCLEHDPTSSKQEEDSDLKSSTPEENKKRKWSLKHRKYVYTSSEDAGVLTDCSSEHGKKERKDRPKTKNTLTQRIKANSIVNASPKISNRHQSNFSFFNTLFDIVFWPYLFLKANR